jgi:hypothetical protein
VARRRPGHPLKHHRIDEAAAILWTGKVRNRLLNGKLRTRFPVDLVGRRGPIGDLRLDVLAHLRCSGLGSLFGHTPLGQICPDAACNGSGPT